MAEYINREDFLKNLTQYAPPEMLWDKYDIEHKLDELPSADVVEVVRCKDCMFYNTSGCADGFGWCEWFNHGAIDSNFCNWGERKDTNA